MIFSYTTALFLLAQTGFESVPVTVKMLCLNQLDHWAFKTYGVRTHVLMIKSHIFCQLNQGLVFFCIAYRTIRYMETRYLNSFYFYKICVEVWYTVRPVEFESTHIVWKTNGLPLTYGRVLFKCIIMIKLGRMVHSYFLLLASFSRGSMQIK